MTYYTKDNREVRIKRIPQFENLNYGSSERGWTVDACLAYIDEEQVGYIKISYIPSETFNRLYPDLFTFLSKERRVGPGQKNSDYTLMDWYVKLATYTHGPHYVNQEQEVREKWTPAILKRKIKSLEQKISKRYQHVYDSFKEYHVDKPRVDYIHVYTEHDSQVFGDFDTEHYTRLNKYNYQRLGIGSILYEDATRWMAERGLRFYASLTQSPDAVAAWNKFKQLGIVKSEIYTKENQSTCTRYYMDETPFRPSVSYDFTNI